MSASRRDAGSRRERRGRATLRMRMTAGLAAALLVAGAGCSLALTNRAPSDYHPEQHGAPSCTDTPGPSVADATLAATYVQFGVWWLLSWESDLLPAPPPEILIPVFALGGLHAASAVYGYNQSLRCKEARWRHELKLSAEPRAGESEAPR
jgi:hypothetical protein